MNNKPIDGIIYKCINIINGKIYIGKTIKPFEWYCASHIRNAFNKTDLKHSHRRKFYSAIRKYGENKFKWDIIERCPVDQLNVREIYWINFFDSFKKGYNNTKGGDGGGGMIPYKRTEEIKQKISKTLMGHKRTTESIKKQIETMKGPNHPLYGVGHKLESIEKMRRAKKGLNNPNAKIYEFISPDGETFIVEAQFNKFCLEHHLWHNAMTSVSRGLKSNHKGWICHQISPKLEKLRMKTLKPGIKK
jgi:group I intron endonuclease